MLEVLGLASNNRADGFRAFGTVMGATVVFSWEDMEFSSSIHYKNSYPNVDRLFFWKTLWLHLHISFLFTT